MKKSIFLFFAAILCAMSISAANMKGGEVLYLKPNSNWTQANARFAIYLCNGSSGAKWVKMTKSGDYYMATVPTGDYKNVIFCRMNPANTTDDWNSKWNQSGDLSFDQKKNLCTINSGQWDCGTNVTWSTHKPTSTASLATSSANIFVGGQATLTPSISNTDVNTLKSTSYAISPATGASISGNTFTATTEGEYTITATVTYYPNGCTGLTSGLNTATATTTITASVPAEETNNVTVSYKFESTEIASATTIASVGVETPSEATAPAITGYTFANWTLGAGVATEDELTANPINIITKSGETDYTLTANYEKFKLTYTVTVPEGTEKCYIVGEMNGWDIDNPIEMTSQGSNVFTVTLEDVTKSTQYKYTSQKSWDYADVQESNRTWSANDVVTAWKDPLATNVHLAGTMTDWDNNKIEFKKATKEATTASIILNLTAGDYKFKIVDNGSWLGNNATIDKTISGWTFASDKGDCPLEATIAGDYTFTWAISTKKLSVTYPTICAITATANDAAMGTIAGAGDYGKGSTATLTATPNDGYLFVNWTKGGVEVATTQEYSFKVTEAVELVANFEAAPEEVHNVTVSYVCGGNKIADDQTVAAVGETTAKTVEAPAIFGYTFASWTLGAGVTSANELTSNTIDINIVAGASDFTLTANYTEIPKVTVYFVNNKKWSKVYAYGWGGSVGETPAWPGQEITANKETEQVADFDVYSYSVVPGSYDNIIFNDGSGTQTETFKWTDGKYYYMNAADKYAGGTAEEVATALGAIVSYDYYIYGNMNDWKEDANYGMTDENEDGIYEKTLTFKNNDEFKVKGNDWYGFDAIEGAYVETSSSNDKNIKITLDADKEVTVKFNSNTKKISFEGLTIDGDVVTYSYYIADNGSLSGNSNWSSKSIGLTDDNSDGIYEKTFTNQAIGTYLMKVTNGTWDDGYVWGFSDVEGAYKEVAAAASDNNIEIKLTDATTFTVKFNSNTKKISFDGLTPLIKQNLKYTVTVPKGTTKCYLVGLGDWNNFREMTQDPGNNRIFTLTVNDVYVTNEYKYSASNNWDNPEVDVNNNDVGNRKWSESDVVVKWKNIDLVPEALTYTVTVPVGTEECYIAGTMNGWAFTAMEKSITTPNTFTIDIANANEAHEYKYACKKNWDYAEVNADGSSVSNRTYSANDVVAKWGYPTYTVAGDNRIVFGEEWKETLTDNDMVDQGDGTYKWTKSKIALKKDTEIKFQVVKNHSWDNKWPNDPWVINTISKDGYYTITIIFKESDQSITATATWTGEAPIKDFSNQPTTLYFHPSFHWTSDNAEFAAYFYNEGFGADAEPKWADMTDSDGDGVYEVANAKQHEYVIICRMNPDRTENKWDDAVSWNKIETGITIPNTAGNLNTCIAFWKNSQGDVPTSECTWVAPTPLTDKNWSDFVTAYAGQTINAVIERSFKSGQYHTLCLPFDIPTNWLGEGTEAYQLTSIVANNTGDKLSLNATKWNTIVAGQPYIIVPVKGSEYEHVIINGVTVKNVSAGTNVASGDGYKATLKAVTTTDGTKTNGSTEYYVGANDGKLYNAQTNKLGLRAIIELTTTGGQPLPPKVRAFVAAGENVETGVDNIVTTDAPVKVIENGQLIIIRDGVKYNVQGQKL